MIRERNKQKKLKQSKDKSQNSTPIFMAQSKVKENAEQRRYSELKETFF